MNKHLDFTLQKDRADPEQDQWKWIPMWKHPDNGYDEHDKLLVGGICPGAPWVESGAMGCGDTLYKLLSTKVVTHGEANEMQATLEWMARKLDFDSDLPPDHEWWGEEEWRAFREDDDQGDGCVNPEL